MIILRLRVTTTADGVAPPIRVMSAISREGAFCKHGSDLSISMQTNLIGIM